MLRHRLTTVCLSVLLLATGPALAEPKVVSVGGDATAERDPVAACGALAASPYEAGWSGRGLADAQIFLDGAEAACEAAVEAVPDSAEAKTWLARVRILTGHATTAVPLLEAANSAGNGFAAYLLSQLLGSTVSNGVEPDDDRAFSLLQQASAAGFAPAEADMADRYTAGTGVTQDLGEAFRLYRSASGHGLGHGAYMAGYFYQDGQGTDVDYSQAAEAFHRAIDLGDPAGWYGLGQLSELGQGVEADYTKAAEAYQRGADAGEKMSETSLAYLLGQGLGVEKNEGKAFVLLSDAANQQYGVAQANLAIAYLFGQGTTVDVGKALDLGLAANSQHVATAAGIVGYMYAEGIGTGRDLGLALQYFEEGAKAGDKYSTDRVAMTQVELGCADQAGSQYEPGGASHGIEYSAIEPDAAIAACEAALAQNPSSVGDKVWLARAYIAAERYRDAVPLLEEGVAAGNPLAQSTYADLLIDGSGDDGSGLAADTARALQLYQSAAAQDFGPAQLALGDLYLEGDLVTADLSVAAEWFRKASRNGVADADNRLSELQNSAAPPVAPSGDLAVGFGRAGPAY